MENSKDLAKRIVTILDDKKAIDALALDIRELTVIADYFVIASGRSDLQVDALYSEVERQLSEMGIHPTHRDAHKGGRWLVLDYSDVIVHIFHDEEREFYDLERLWSDAKKVTF